MRLGTSWLDWKLGGRMLVKYPGLSVIGGVTIAAAIGVGAAWFEVTRQLVKPRLPLPDGERIVRIDSWDAAGSVVESRMLYDFEVWREQLTAIQSLGAYRSLERNLITPDGAAQPAAVAEISVSTFRLTRVPPLLGRSLIEEDAAPGAADVVVIGYDVWQSRFNGARDVIGRTVRLGRTSATIVGVMPEGFRFPVSHQLWVPLRVTSAAPRGGPSVHMFGQLAAGATLESAQAELTTIGRRIAAMNPTTHAQLLPRVSLYAAPASDDRQFADLMRLSNIIAWLILAAASANVATLMFARNATREPEIVVRNALGASRARVMIQLFIEAFVLCAVAAFAGVVAASFALKYGMRLWPDPDLRLPFWWQFRIRPATVVYATVLALIGALLVGLLPALKATGKRVQPALTRMASDSTTMQFGGVWSVMIVLQVTFASLCLPIAMSLAFDVLRQHNAPAPFPMHEYLTFRPELDRDATFAATGELRAADFRAHRLTVLEELRRRLESEPSVVAVTFADRLPGMGHPATQLEAQRGTDPPFPVAANIAGDRAWTAAVDIKYFDAFRRPIVAGRAFHTGDVEAANVAIINETLARSVGGNALGVRLRYAGSGTGQEAHPWYEVVGIVRNRDNSDLDFMFVPVSAAVSPLIVGIHVRGDAAVFAPRLRALATQLEPGLRLYDLVRLDEFGRREGRLVIRAIIAILVITLLVTALSAAGLYSLMSVAVTRRTREIGIRLAIGASPRAVLAAVFARAAVQVGIGIVLGNALLPPLMTALGQSELTVGEVLPSMLAAAGAMLLTGLVACGVPARRALRIQPTEAVRYVG